MADQKTRSNAAEQGAWARPVPTRLGEALMALALFAAALFFVGYATLLPFGKLGLPGPGFFPFALGIVLGLLALAILYRVLRSANEGEAIFLGHRDVLIVLAALASVAMAFERADTYVVLGVFTAVLLLLVARVALWQVVLGATLGMVAVWAVFGLTLGVRLPSGAFWQQFLGLIFF
jgi:Tripartite tricarboxylate transporter TctB family